MIVIAVPLHRFTPGFANRVSQRFDSLLLRSVHTRHVENLFLA